MTMMVTVPGEDRLRVDLAVARRVGATITDPLSVRTVSTYISELERQLDPARDMQRAADASRGGERTSAPPRP